MDRARSSATTTGGGSGALRLLARLWSTEATASCGPARPASPDGSDSWTVVSSATRAGRRCPCSSGRNALLRTWRAGGRRGWRGAWASAVPDGETRRRPGEPRHKGTVWVRPRECREDRGSAAGTDPRRSRWGRRNDRRDDPRRPGTPGNGLDGSAALLNSDSRASGNLRACPQSGRPPLDSRRSSTRFPPPCVLRRVGSHRLLDRCGPTRSGSSRSTSSGAGSRPWVALRSSPERARRRVGYEGRVGTERLCPALHRQLVANSAGQDAPSVVRLRRFSH